MFTSDLVNLLNARELGRTARHLIQSRSPSEWGCGGRKVIQDWSIWFCSGSPHRESFNSSWATLLLALKQSVFKPSDWLCRQARRDCDIRTTQEQALNRSEKESNSASIKKAIEGLEADRSSTRRTWLLSCLSKEALRQRKLDPTCDISELVSAARTHLGDNPSDWKPRSQTAPFFIDNTNTQHDMETFTEWVLFTDQLLSPSLDPFWIRDQEWPLAEDLSRRPCCCLIRWFHTGDWVCSPPSVTRTTATGSSPVRSPPLIDGDSISLQLTGPPPDRLLPCQVFVDLGASDFVIKLTQWSGVTASATTLSWGSLFRLFISVDSSPFLGKRETTLFEILVRRWASFLASEPHTPCDPTKVKPCPFKGSLTEATAPDPALPPASVMLNSTDCVISSRTFVIPPAAIPNYQAAVATELGKGIAPRDAVLAAAAQQGTVVVRSLEAGHRAPAHPRKCRVKPRSFRHPLSSTRLTGLTDLILAAELGDKGTILGDDRFVEIVPHFKELDGAIDYWADLPDSHPASALALDKVLIEARKAKQSTLIELAIVKDGISQIKLRKRKVDAANLYLDDRSKALRTMAKPSVTPTPPTLAQRVWEVRDKSKCTHSTVASRAFEAGLSSLPPVFTAPPECHWSSSATISPINPSDSPAFPPACWQAVSQPPAITQESLEEWRRSLGTTELLAWHGSAAPPINLPRAAVTWPVEPLPFHDRIDSLTALVTSLVTDGRSITLDSEARLVKVSSYPATFQLDWSTLLVGHSVPDIIISTDGSGSGDSVGPGGFGCLVLSRCELFVIIGGHDATTSGEMELAAAAEGACWLAKHAPTASVLFISDYMSWVEADLDEVLYSRAAGKCNRPVWMLLVETFLKTALSTAPLRAHRVHAPAHKGLAGHWGSNLGELADGMAGLGKQLRIAEKTKEWAPPPVIFTSLDLTRPILAVELRLAAKRRTSNSPDSTGLTNDLLVKAGDAFFTTLALDNNSALFSGDFPSNGDARGVVGCSHAIGKPDGGYRFLTIPDCLGALFSSVLARRLSHLLLDSKACSLSQKSNIQFVAGTDELVFLVLGALFDFHAAAAKNLLPIGAVRIFIFNDISKAFDRVELNILSQAIRVVLPTLDPFRFLSVLSSLFGKLKVVVTDGKAFIVIDKQAGVPQGDSMSGYLFLILMEYARMLNNPRSRSRIRLRCAANGQELIFECDFADDQIRADDSVSATHAVLVELQRCLKLVGLEMNLEKIRLLALLFGPHGVCCFDPNLTLTAPNGNAEPIKCFDRTSWIRVAGVHFNYKGDFKGSESLLRERDLPLIAHIRDSPFPVVAKLDALRTMATRASEYIFVNAWIQPDVIAEVDIAERKSIRAFLGNRILPNSFIKGELGLSNRGDRQEILYICGFIRRLYSHDPTVKLFALLMTRDLHLTPGACSAPAALLSPRFFDWTKVPAPSGGILHAGVRLAHAARKWGVAIWCESGTIRVEVHGRPAPKDSKVLLHTLTKLSSVKWLRALENRISTNPAHVPAPQFAIGWGSAGRPLHHRKEDSAFLRGGPFSDSEVGILVGLRLLLWPTPFRKSILAGKKYPAFCTCGSIGTASHLLSVPASSTHSDALRAIPNARHSALVLHLGPWIRKAFPDWEFILGEQLTPDASAQDYRDIILAAAREKRLTTDNIADPAQHCKPDFLLVKRKDNHAEFLLFDVCTGSDDNLDLEDKFLKHTKLKHSKVDLLQPGLFDVSGLALDRGLELFPPDAKAKAAKRNVRLKTLVYGHRYAALKKVLCHSNLSSLQIFPIAVSTSGWIPNFTLQTLVKFSSEKRTEEVGRLLRGAAWRFAIAAYRAWRAE